MKKLIFILLVLYCIQANAALLEVNGVFRGENLFIRNSFNNDDNESCITSVYLNGRDLKVDVKHLTIEVNFKKYLTKGEKIDLRIYHKSYCKPQIINIGAIKRQTLFAFSSFSMDEQNYRWVTRGEQKGAKFTIQRFLNGEWEEVKSYDANGSLSGVTYLFPSLHYSGVTRYRLKYEQLDGFVEYSDAIDFRSKKLPVSFYPTKVKGKITFVSKDKQPVKYEIYDIEGYKIMEGESIQIDCTQLEGKKVYTLVFDNQHRKFQKLNSNK
jgi:hypothetical protein